MTGRGEVVGGRREGRREEGRQEGGGRGTWEGNAYQVSKEL